MSFSSSFDDPGLGGFLGPVPAADADTPGWWVSWWNLALDNDLPHLFFRPRAYVRLSLPAVRALASGKEPPPGRKTPESRRVKDLPMTAVSLGPKIIPMLLGLLLFLPAIHDLKTNRQCLFSFVNSRSRREKGALGVMAQWCDGPTRRDISLSFIFLPRVLSTGLTCRRLVGPQRYSNPPPPGGGARLRCL